MKRRSKFLAFIISAAVTFGSLYVIAGPQQFAKFGRLGNHHSYCTAQENQPAKDSTGK